MTHVEVIAMPAKPGNEEKTRYIEQVAEPGKAIVGTNTNPFWKWKSPWYEQVSIQVVQSIHLATVLGMVGHNVTGESYYSYEELGRLMGKTGKTAYRQMRRLRFIRRQLYNNTVDIFV
jgi:hypothetical protein